MLHIPLLQPSPFPSPRVAKPKPAGDIIPVITWKLNSMPHTEVSRRISCSSRATVTLWMECGECRGPPSEGAIRKNSVNVPDIIQMARFFLSLMRRREFSTYNSVGSIRAVLMYWLFWQNKSALRKDLVLINVQETQTTTHKPTQFPTWTSSRKSLWMECRESHQSLRRL